MTELERKEKYLKKAIEKHPDVKDEDTIKSIALYLEKKDSRKRAILSLLAGLLSHFVAAFTFDTVLGWLCICFGFVAYGDAIKHFRYSAIDTAKVKQKYNGLDDLYAQKKNMQKNPVEISSRYARSGGKGERSDPSAIIMLVLFAVCAVICLAKGEFESGISIIVFIIVLAAVASRNKKRQDEKRAECIYNNDFKLLKTTLADKEDRLDASCDTITKEYFFIFRCEDVVLEANAPRNEFIQRQLGEECYLLLFTQGSRNHYYVEKVIWADEAIISKDMEGHMATEHEIAKRNRY